MLQNLLKYNLTFYLVILIIILFVSQINAQNKYAIDNLDNQIDTSNVLSVKDKIKLENEIDSLLNLYTVAEANGNYKEALAFYDLYKVYNDSLNNHINNLDVTKLQIANIQLEKENLKKDNELQTLKLNQELGNYEILRKDYNIRYWAFLLLVLSFLGGFFIYFYLKQQKDEIHQHNQKMIFENELFEKSDVIGFELNPENFTFKFVSKNIKSFLAHTVEEILDKQFLFFDLFPNSNTIKSQILSNINSKKSHFQFDLSIIDKNKHEKLVTVFFDVKYLNDKVEFIAGYFIDISEITQLINDLENTKTFLNETNEAAKIGGWSFNLKTKELQWTEFICKLHGIAINEQPNIDVALNYYKDGDSRERIIRSFENAVQNQEDYEGEFEFVKKNGETIWIFTNGKCIFDKNEFIRIDGVFQDITERKRLENNLNKAIKISFNQVNKLQNFTQIVSHNLRTNTASFFGIIELLKDEKDATVRLELIDILQENTWHLQETLNNLNEIIKIQGTENKQIKSIDVAQEIQNVLIGLKVLFTNNQVNLINNIPDGISINFIPAYFESILQNLLTNAVKYRHPNRLPEITLNLNTDEDFFILEVKDNGVGLDLDQNKDKVFGMYNTFHKNKDARGIGLYITKNQIETLGGKIEMKSKPDIGSIFILYFRKTLEAEFMN